MAYRSKTRPEENQFLRQAFDSSYVAIDKAAKFQLQDVVDRIRAIDRQTKLIVIIGIASFIAAVSALYLAQQMVNYLDWVSRPSLMERLAPPYSLAERADTLKIGTGQYLLLPDLGAGFVEDHSIPVDNLLSARLLETQYIGTEAYLENGSIFMPAEAVETDAAATDAEAEEVVDLEELDTIGLRSIATAYQVGHNDQVSIAIVEYADATIANEVLHDLHYYSRSIGRTGNFNLIVNETVPYFYSSTRNNFSFTWRMQSMIFSVTGTNWNIIGDYINLFAFEYLTWTDVEPVVEIIEEPVIEDEAALAVDGAAVDDAGAAPVAGEASPETSEAVPDEAVLDGTASE